MPGKVCLAISLLLHLAVGWWRLGMVNDHSATAVEPTVPKELVSTILLPPPAAPATPPPESPPSPPQTGLPPSDHSAPLIDYAAAPPAATEEKEPDVGSEPVATADANSTVPDRPAADTGSLAKEVPHPAGRELDMEGLQSPTYRVSVLTSEDVDRLLQSGHACIVVFDGQNTLVASGPFTAPTRLESLSTSPWRTRLSQRMLGVPHAVADVVYARLHTDYGYTVAPRVRLELSAALDAPILVQQRQAVTDANLAWEACAETVGRFRWSGNQVTFEVTEVKAR